MGEDDELGYLGDVTSGADDDELGYLGNVETNDDELGYLSSYIQSSFPELSGNPSLAAQVGSALQKVGASAFDALKKTFTNKDGSIDWRSVAGAAGGLYGMYQANKPQEKVGYQGGIPEYTAVRERVPTTYDPNRRPGSSGQQYFTAPQFVKKGDTTAIEAARTAAVEQATALANANATNPARQTLPAATTVTSPAGGGTAVASRPASSVIDDLKVPTYTKENAPTYPEENVPDYSYLPEENAPDYFFTLPKEAPKENVQGMQYAAGGITGLYGADVESLYSDNITRKKDYAAGGLASMAQGRYLGGTTDGMADKIPARIGDKQEARLSHGEFVVPADVVSHLGNGNSEAGAQRLYSMMDKIRKARTGNTKQGKQINPDKFLA